MDTTRERGGCLTLYLAVSGILGVLALLTALGASMQLGLSSLLCLLVVPMVIYLACVYGVWQWQRWGVYGLFIATIVSNTLQIINGVRPGVNIIAMIVQLAILYFLISPRWHEFE